MTEFGPWDRIRHTYKTHIGTVVREGNITTISEIGIAYVTGPSSGTFFAQPENVELISKRTRKKVKPTLKDKKQRALIKDIEREMKSVLHPDEYEDEEFMRGWEKGQACLAEIILEKIAESRK